MPRKALVYYSLVIMVFIMNASAWAGTALLSWDPNTESDLAGYKAYYGIASGSYTQSIDVGNVTTYTINGLTEGLTHFFAVTAYDTSGDESGFSNEVSKTIPDTIPPVLSAIISSNITSTSATITWATNEAATSQVDYGTTAYGSSSPLDSALLTSHSRTLSGLTASTTYHYRVKSTDAAGNTATSGDNTFTTSAAPDTTPPMDISEFKADPEDGQVQLTWTNPPDPDYMGVRIRYRIDGSFPANPQDGQLVGDFTGQPLASGNHVHTGLSNGTTYYYAAFTYDTSGNYSQTVHAHATPQALGNISTPLAADNWNSSPGFGCGRLKDISSDGPGPTAGQTALNFAVFVVLFLLIKQYQKKCPPAKSEWAL